MQAIFEPIFDAAYLILVVTLGIIMLAKAKQRQHRLFGAMAVVLGLGDAFHLVPRMAALWAGGITQNTPALGFGKFVTSITMTVFYVILYFIWKKRYGEGTRKLDIAVFVLAATRVLLCLFPQNDWFGAAPPLSWGIYRNLPFALLGLVIIVLYFQKARKTGDKSFRFLWLAVTLSFLFYLPVVLFAETYPSVGLLMLPKTVCYAWIVVMGFLDMKKQTDGADD